GSGAFAVQIGQTTTGFNLSSNQYQQTIVPSGTHDADLGLFYTFAIRNTGRMPIFVQSACVRDENNGSARPQTCYFANHSFDGLPGTQSWTTTGSVTDGLIPGEILMYDDDTIAQNAILFPDGVSSHIYFVSIIATVGGA